MIDTKATIHIFFRRIDINWKSKKNIFQNNSEKEMSSKLNFSRRITPFSLAGGPAHLSASHDVEVKVVHRLRSVTAVVHHCNDSNCYLCIIFFLSFNYWQIWTVKPAHYISYWKFFWQIIYRKDTLLKGVPNSCCTHAI